MNIDFSKWTEHKELIKWIQEIALLCTPRSIHLCTGSQEEYEKLCHHLVEEKVFISLNPKTYPGSYWCASDPSDVARVEDSTYICSVRKEDAGPTNNWEDPKIMKERLLKLFHGGMKGRTMYVVPFCMGPLHSPFSIIGVQITDSAYAVVNMKIMTRMGREALEMLGSKGRFVPCLHSVGAPLENGKKDVPWPCSSTKYIVHFPEEKSIWSYGSGYGGNALLGKKCLALRIASVIAREEMWLAEHMLIVGITNPEGEKKYFVAAFPSGCGKTNLAMFTPTLPGWKVECVGDDIAWMRAGKDGMLHAINPEYGFFGIAPGTSLESNANAMKTIKSNTIYTNVALTPEKEVWWEGMTKEAPPSLISWKNKPWTPHSGEVAAHPNARFTAPAKQCPIVSNQIDNVNGVPISGIIFGGRRDSLEPLIYESFEWDHGVFLGAALSSEMTAAAKGTIGKLRHDPFAMLPFCGYNMGDYFSHWIEMGKHIKHPPKIFHVNWFKKDEDGKFLWPGYGENGRILKWCFERCDNKFSAQPSAIGLLPYSSDLDLSGLSISRSAIASLFNFDKDLWQKEVDELKRYFEIFGDRFPIALRKQLHLLQERIFSL